MKAQEIIEKTFGDFRNYLKSVAGIDPNRFSMDAWMTLLLYVHFMSYQALLQQMRAAQAQKEQAAEQEVAEDDAPGETEEAEQAEEAAAS